MVNLGSVHTYSVIGYTPLRFAEGYALSQQMRLGLGGGDLSKKQAATFKALISQEG